MTPTVKVRTEKTGSFFAESTVLNLLHMIMRMSSKFANFKLYKVLEAVFENCLYSKV